MFKIVGLDEATQQLREGVNLRMGKSASVKNAEVAWNHVPSACISAQRPIDLAAQAAATSLRRPRRTARLCCGTSMRQTTRRWFRYAADGMHCGRIRVSIDAGGPFAVRELRQVPPPGPHAAQRLAGPAIHCAQPAYNFQPIGQDGTVWLWDLHAPTVPGNHIQFPAKDCVRQV